MQFNRIWKPGKQDKLPDIPVHRPVQLREKCDRLRGELESTPVETTGL